MKNLFFSVAIVFIALTALNSCTKTRVPLAFPDNYISKMGGTRYWQGLATGGTPNGMNSSSYTPFSNAINDTFALQIDGTKINHSFAGHIQAYCPDFNYSSLDTAAKCLIFTSCDGSVLKYYYQANTMSFHGSCEGRIGFEGVDLHTL